MSIAEAPRFAPSQLEGRGGRADFDRRAATRLGNAAVMGLRYDPEECDVASVDLVSALFQRYGHYFEGRKRVLEIGTGVARFTPELAKRAEQVIALDFSSGMLSQAEERLAGYDNVALVQADAISLPLEDNSFDAVFVAETFLHLADDEHFAQAMAEVGRVAGPDSVILFCEPLSEGDSSERIHEGFVRRPLAAYAALLGSRQVSDISTHTIITQEDTLFVAA